jgi:tellurite resistance protein
MVKSEVLAWMADVAAADGDIDPKERATLDELARKVGTRAGELERMLRSKSARSDAARLGPRDTREARLWLAAAARTALADGSVSKSERLLLERRVLPYGLLAADVTLVVNEERRALFRHAKEALRVQRRERN